MSEAQTNATQTFMRYSADTDFACESEFIKKFNESPKLKQWSAFYDRNERSLRKSYEKLLVDLVSSEGFKEVEIKKSYVQDILVKKDNSVSFENLKLIEDNESGEKVLLSYLKDSEDNCRILMYSNVIDSAVEKRLSKWISSVKNKFKVIEDPDLPTFKIIAQDSGGLKTIDREIKKFGPEIETMLDDHYNEGFKEFSDAIVNDINTKSHGIILLHGEPGTGKTNYIRYLINKIKNKDLFYIPPELVNILTQPSFIEFVMNNGDAVFLVEDAEAVIESRENGRNSAVNNILNLCDGIIGEVIRAQFICTFNCGFNQIDNALKRPGRMLGEYKFEKLTVEKANLLGKKLHGDGFNTEEELTLAEIYNVNQKKFIVNQKKNSVGIEL
jgi:hypothetical protein